MTRTGLMTPHIEFSINGGSRKFQSKMTPVLVPAAMKRPRCPGMSENDFTGGGFLERDSSGERGVEEPLDISRGSSNAVAEAKVD